MGLERILAGVLRVFVMLLLILSAAGSYIVGILAGAAEGDTQTQLFAIGAGFLAFPIVVEFVRTARARSRAREAETRYDQLAAEFEKLEQEYEARLVVAMADVVTPVADLVAQITVSPRPEQARLRGNLQQAVVTAAARLCGPDGETRAVFFALNGNELREAAYASRADKPTTVFIDGRDEKGTAAHRLVREQDYVFVRDVNRETRPGLQVPAGTKYRTYLAVAVYAGHRPLGMLAVDALKPGDIKVGAVGAARALAQILAIGLV